MMIAFIIRNNLNDDPVILQTEAIPPIGAKVQIQEGWREFIVREVNVNYVNNVATVIIE